VLSNCGLLVRASLKCLLCQAEVQRQDVLATSDMAYIKVPNTTSHLSLNHHGYSRYDGCDDVSESHDCTLGN